MSCPKSKGHNPGSVQKALAFSKLDQENLNQHLIQWQKNGNGHNAFFQPYVSKMTPSSSDCCAENISDEQEFEQTLLLVLQEEWQKHILERYGNTISLIDATYKTTQYDLPLFFICVRTNVGYVVVAEFVVQSEQSDKICEAIEVNKEWNPNWNPAYFMCDYSKAELLALEACFPSVKLYLCDFHREQAWERWTKKRLSKENVEILLSLLRNCAGAPSCEDQEHVDDYYYQQAVNKLKESPVWQNSSHCQK